MGAVQNIEGSSDRQRWERPELRRLEVGAAEAATLLGPDGDIYS